MKRKEISSLTVATLFCSLYIMILWVGSMYFATGKVAKVHYQNVLRAVDEYEELVEEYFRCGDEFVFFGEDSSQIISQEDKMQEGYREYLMSHMANLTDEVIRHHFLEHDYEEVEKSEWRWKYPTQSAVVFYDNQDHVISNSGIQVVFEYLTEDEWKYKQDTENSRYGWIDVQDKEELSFFEKELRCLSGLRALRMTGYFEGVKFYPVSVDYAPEFKGQKWNVIQAAEQEGTLEWINVYAKESKDELDKKLVTIYAVNPGMLGYESGGTITSSRYGNHENILKLAYAANLNGLRGDVVKNYNEVSLKQIILYDVKPFYDDLNGYESSEETTNIKPEFIMVTVIQTRPLLVAAYQLTRVYLVAFLLAVFVCVLVHILIKRLYAEPLKQFCRAIHDDNVNMGNTKGIAYFCSDIEQLLDGFVAIRSRWAKDKDEIVRLNTALTYVKDAEQKRRQLVSNIAHEWKTPLAIIHSYVEGLQENIAESKREKYLNVISEETERLDGMVLEMLELSRLEAGRVKLNREEFSLPELTYNIMGKLELAIGAKQLQVQYDFPKNLEGKVLADKTRIGQVIENFATNAVKYTPIGGTIRIWIGVRKDHVRFSVENDCEGLTPNDLAKVWDTFYRVDESRSTAGTGLGLAIAKNIVELHEGTCGARNTDRGVEFFFTI